MQNEECKERNNRPAFCIFYFAFCIQAAFFSSLLETRTPGGAGDVPETPRRVLEEA
jgi:hypothetical protein